MKNLVSKTTNVSTLLIADVHLNPKEWISTLAFFHFLNDKAKESKALYILGDLFEIWIGDDDPSPLYHKVASAIKQLVDSGTACYFIHGNHDFLIGKNFAKKSGMILLPEEQVVNIHGHRILIMHGDTLCTNDKNYQLFRSKILNPWIKNAFLSLPIFIRRTISTKIKSYSKISKQKKSSSIMKMNPQKIIKLMEKYEVQWLICGHAHCSNIYKSFANGKDAAHIVLDSWKHQGSMVKVTKESVKLLNFSF